MYGSTVCYNVWRSVSRVQCHCIRNNPFTVRDLNILVILILFMFNEWSCWCLLASSGRSRDVDDPWWCLTVSLCVIFGVQRAAMCSALWFQADTDTEGFLLATGRDVCGGKGVGCYIKTIISLSGQTGELFHKKKHNLCLRLYVGEKTNNSSKYVIDGCQI